ncbi:MAG: prolyl-tRNA synthetase associated domain-containing protein [Lachnospiraceae bacterium]|nr:prolyl-tRNA synthetase associated domain-containing protein [Lachnospiraceae bacterium]
MNKQETYDYLDQRKIRYEVMEHRAIYNMEELAELHLPHPEADAKNLFVRDDKKRQYYLITVKGNKRVDLKAFKKANGTKSLEFAKPNELKTVLGLTPGSVTPLGLLNDEEGKVIFYLDGELTGGLIGCHPNDNTATVWLQTDDLLSLIREHGNPAYIVEIE